MEGMAYPSEGMARGEPIVEVEADDGYARTLLGLALKVKTRKY